MNLLGQFGNLVLLTNIEVTLVDAVSDDVLAKLAAGHMMQNAAFFAGVDDVAVVERGELFRQLRFLGEIGKEREDGVVNGTSAVVEIEIGAHGGSVALHAVGAAVAAHRIGELDLCGVFQRLKGCKRIHILPGNHRGFLP